MQVQEWRKDTEETNLTLNGIYSKYVDLKVNLIWKKKKKQTLKMS